MSTPILDIDGLTYGYGHGAPPALIDVSLRIDPAEHVGLVGPNGAGKSTLMLHTNGVLAQSDRVRVQGRPVRGRDLAHARQRVGLVFQDADDQLFMPTVFDDVAFGPLNQGLAEQRARQRVAEALAAVGLSGFETRSSHHLSGGEKRRLAMATVLAMRPSLLVLDEPGSSLDARGRRALIDVLRAQQAAILLATHDLALVREVCARCIVMDEGRVVADGPVAVILDDRALLERHGLV